ncbi:MAG: PIN domain-containing protein [Acidimicrobiales bacterium]
MLFVEILRLLLVIAGILVGKSIGSEINHSSMSQVVGLVLGALVAYVVGGILARLVDKELQAAVERLRSMPAGEVFAGSVVGTSGLLLGLVISLPVIALVHSSIAYPLVAVLTWVLAALGTRVGITKGRQIIRAAGLANLLDPKEPLPSSALIADSSAVMDGSLAVLGESGLLPGGIIVPDFVIDQVKTLSESPDPVKSRRASRGLDTLNILRTQGITVTVLNERVPEEESEAGKVLALSTRLGLRLATCSSHVAEQHASSGEISPAIVDLKLLARNLVPEHPPGEKLVIDLLSEGRQSRQAVGYLGSGELVVVNDASHLVGEEQVEVVVSSTRHTSQGILIFAKLPS